MFCNTFVRAIGPHISQFNKFNILRLSSASSELQNDIKDALDIEANLFENSSLQHKPATTRDVLRKHKMPTVKQRVAAKPPAQFVSAAMPKATYNTPRPAAPPLIQDSGLELAYTRLSLRDPLLATLLTTVRSRKRRDKHGQIIVEGRRLINEALQCGLHMQALFFSQKDQLAQLRKEVAEAQRTQGTKIYKVPQHDLKTWSTLVTPPGLLALFDRPTARSLEHTLHEQYQQGSEPLPITVVCDNIREPNNLGSIIRTCAALPCRQVVVTHGCCDPWDSKALRGGCGAQFRLPIRDDVRWEELALTIPPEVADDCHVFIAENNPNKLADTTNAINYTELRHTGAHNILIIGGESHGVSEEAYQFMKLVGGKGKCVYIPLAAGIDSLNVVSALTLLLFELRKQLIR